MTIAGRRRGGGKSGGVVVALADTTAVVPRGIHVAFHSPVGVHDCSLRHGLAHAVDHGRPGRRRHGPSSPVNGGG